MTQAGGCRGSKRCPRGPGGCSPDQARGPQELRMRLAGAEGERPEARGGPGRSWLWKMQWVGLGGTQNRGRWSGEAAGAAPSQGRWGVWRRAPGGYSQITTSSQPRHAGKPRGTGPRGGIKGDSKPVSRPQGQQSRRGSPAPPALSEQQAAAWLPDRLPWRRPQANRLWLFRRDLLAHRGSWRGKTNRLTWPGRSR